MHKNQSVQRDCLSNTSSYSQSFSKMYKHQAIGFSLKDLWLRKSFFFPAKGLDESYASRNHIAGADIPIVQIIHSSQRWLLVQTPKFSVNFFKKLNQFKLGNPFQQLLRVFKGLYALTKVFGYFRPTNGMITLERKDVRVWINVDIFNNQPQMKLRSGIQGQKEFVLAFLAMVQIEMLGWERASNINTVQDTIRLIEWRSRIYRGSFTAVNASQKANHLQSEQQNSLNSSELISHTQNIKSCKSAYYLGIKKEEDFLEECLSSSIVMHAEETRQVPKKIHKLFSDQKEEMKNSIYEDGRALQQEHDVRKTKKKFNLTSTSSTLEKISDKLGSTMRRKMGNTLKVIKQTAQNQKLIQSVDHRTKQSKKGGLYKSQQVNIATELDGLFQQDKMQDLKFGIEGNKEELQKIAEEMEELLIW